MSSTAVLTRAKGIKAPDDGAPKAVTDQPPASSLKPDQFVQLKLPGIRAVASPRLATDHKTTELTEIKLEESVSRHKERLSKRPAIIKTDHAGLRDSAYQAVSEDSKSQGVQSPLPPKSAISLQRHWYLNNRRVGGEAAPGLLSAVVNTNILPYLLSYLLPVTRRHHENQETSTAVHEVAHATGVNVLTRDVKDGSVVDTRVGLELYRFVSRSPAIFLVLEEAHVCGVEHRSLLRAGYSEAISSERKLVKIFTSRLSGYEQRAFFNLLRKYDIGSVDRLGRRFFEVTTCDAIHPNGGSIPYGAGYNRWISALKVLAAEALPALTPEESWNTFSKMLSRAHAGDAGAFKTLMVTLKRGLGSDALNILGEIKSKDIAMSHALMLALAASSSLEPGKRASFRRELLQFTRGHLMLSDSLRAGRVPPAHAVVEATRYSGKLPDKLRSQAVDLAEKFTREKVPLKAYLLLSKMQIPRDQWPQDTAAAIATMPTWRKIQGHLMRVGADLLARSIKLGLLNPDPLELPYYYKRNTQSKS